MQLLGWLLIVAGSAAVTGSAWPLIVGGVVLLAAVEVAPLLDLIARRRELAAIRRRYEAETSRLGGRPLPVQDAPPPAPPPVRRRRSA